MKYIYIFLLSFMVISTTAKAQESKESVVSNQLWLDYNLNKNISENFNFFGKLGFKTISPKSWNKAVASTEITWLKPKFIVKKLKYKEKIYFGIDFFFTTFNDLPNVIEITPYQGYSLTWPNRRRFDIRHQMEFRERLQWNTTNFDFSNGVQMSYEGKVKLKLQGDLIPYGKGLYLSLSAKFWWNLVSADIFNDVLRITPGIGYQINHKWKAAFYVGYNYTRNLSAEEFDNNSTIYRFRLYYTID